MATAPDMPDISLDEFREAAAHSKSVVLETPMLAARCMGISSGHARLLAFAFGSGIAGLAGGLWAGFLGSSGEPGNYDFQISIITLCLLIVGGMGSILGVLIGALIMIGFNSIILVKISQFMNSAGLVSTTNVFTQPNNWKYMIFGMALILMMRYRPQGVCPEQVREDKSVPPATKAVRPL